MGAEVETTVQRGYKFRLYPTPEQEQMLLAWERQLRWLYNLAHEQRLLAAARWRPPRDEETKGLCPSCGVRLPKKKAEDEKRERVKHTAACAWVDYFRQQREMTELMTVDPRLGEVVCCARQEVLRDLDKAWQRWRKRLGGRPRFKRRIDSVRLYLSTTKHWKIEVGALRLSGAASPIGAIKIRQDRPWPGDAKFSSCAIVRDVDEWYATFPLEFTLKAEPQPREAVGINRGAIHAIADSDGRVVDSPRYYERALDRLKLLGRRLSRKLEGAKKRKAERPWRNVDKARQRLARQHQYVRRQRSWFLHEQSAHYARQYKLIGIEDLSTRQIVADPKVEEAAHWSNRCKRHGCGEKVVKRRLCQKHFDEVRRIPKRPVHRSILDAGWYEFGRQLKYKAEARGGRVVAVQAGAFDADQPSGISRTCSGCGAELGAAASGHRVATCDRCGLVELGDINAGRNVLARALRAEPPVPKAPRASIKIKGRAKAQPETTAKPVVDASGGDPPVRGPVEGGTGAREGPHPERTVLPRRGRRGRPPPRHDTPDTRE